MRVLALDGATEACSVALLCNGEIIERHAESGKANAPQILAMIEEVLSQAQVSFSMLDGIAASIGPGAFTGVRITVAVAQGLAFGAGLSVAPVSTLEALGLRVLTGEVNRAVACLDARMGEVYWGSFAQDAHRLLIAESPAAVGTPESVSLVGKATGIGRGFSAYPELLALPGLIIDEQHSLALPRAREIVRLGASRLARGEGLDPAELTPFYLRDKVALTEAERAALP
jgi:tRNA threonylcarbamoyladenosine biosynthesis protein TsaB